MKHYKYNPNTPVDHECQMQEEQYYLKVHFSFRQTKHFARSRLCCIKMVSGHTNTCIPPSLNKHQQKISMVKINFLWLPCNSRPLQL